MKVTVDQRQLVVQGARPDEDRAIQKLVGQLEWAQIGHVVSVRPKRLTVRVHLPRVGKKPHEAVEVYDGMH